MKFRTRPNKYKNKWTSYDSPLIGERNYQSKAEARRAGELDFMVKSGLVNFWLPQPSFPLPGGAVYRADFQIHWKLYDRPLAPGGTYFGELTVVPVTFEDVKGFDTPMSKYKRNLVKEIYGVDIVIVKAR
jgi:hypothetical protein